jgi:hypothetical protein
MTQQSTSLCDFFISDLLDSQIPVFSVVLVIRLKVKNLIGKSQGRILNRLLS